MTTPPKIGPSTAQNLLFFLPKELIVSHRASPAPRRLPVLFTTRQCPGINAQPRGEVFTRIGGSVGGGDIRVTARCPAVLRSCDDPRPQKGRFPIFFCDGNVFQIRLNP